MTEPLRLVIDALLGLAILALLVWLIWRWRQMGPDLVIARMNLLQANTRWAIAFLTIAVVLILAGAAIEIWQDLSQQSWFVDHEWLDTISMISLLLGLITFIPIVRVRPRKMG